jgi:hypothetical protein
MTTLPPSDAQIEFDSKYITAAEIIKTLNITRSNLLYARKTGKLPVDPIILNEGRLFIWERQKVQHYLDAWHIILDARRG